ncbi:hypothetical protein QWJ26_30065 [Streptomyces sp. CSDS2]|uniref:hypothetical protein n=1 Tax=Streptomyces sp. CSDS2 TaxID=3055051 RepID=UPI0025B0EC8B|nr:hypothetical protein [Streptomyces sp. CSDS2]MDN3263983.1 hypothetical protein [Streptomyces sp. CSDS2]
MSPEAGLATAAKLKPHKALQAMGGVGGAVDRSVGDEHQALASAPPSTQRPAGAPQTLRGKPKTDAPAEYSQDRPQEAQAPEQKDAEVTGAKQPEGQIEAEKAEEPGGWDTFKMALGFIGGKIVNGVASLFGADKPVVDPQALAAKFAGLPTKDEALKQARAGDAPGVGMTGAAEQSAGEQDGHVDAKGQQTIGTARDDAGRRMGEDQVYPDAPKETMTAKVPGARGGQGAAADSGGATGAVPPEAASEVAEHEQGPQFQTAFTEGTKSMSEGRQAKDRDVRDAQDRHRQKVDAEIAANTKSQAAEREKARGEVTAQREDWRAEQDEQLKSLGDKKSERHDKVRKDVADKEKKTDDDVDNEKQNSDKKIQDESDKAEREADQKRDGAVQESGNWVSKAFDWIKQKVIEIKNAIVRVIRAARDAVVGFIKNFKDTVERWINEARKNIVDAIKNLIKDLIEFAVAMVRAVIELAARIRRFVTGLISAAIALVNRLAQALKQAVSDLLDAIGKLLSGLLDILKKSLQAAVKAVVDAVKAVLEFASKLLSALGAWMMIAVDFLSDPGGWLGGAKNSAVDGAKNHLFREVSAAVKAWFQEKIQEIIGVPKAVIDKLIKGGFSLDRIVKEAWDAVVPQLPLIIGELVITKVVARLIPGAGWVMAVIDAIRTAWGALSAILSSLDAVLTWLKVVRTGGAGILFAKAVAAGVVALLEVLYQALLSGIGKYVAKVGRRLRGVAAGLGKDKPGKPGDRGRAGTDDTGGRSPTRKPKGEEPAGRKPGSDAATPRHADPRAPQTRDGRPGKPTAPAPTAKDRNGRPKDPTEKPDTKPTPSAKPKPAPESRPKPRTEPEHRGPNAPGTGDQDTPDTSKPQNRDGKTSDKPTDRDPGKPKGSDRDTPGSRKPDADQKAPSNKPRGEDGDNRAPKEKGEGKDGKERKPEHESKQPKRTSDKHEGRSPKRKDSAKKEQDKKDKRKKEEDSKDKRLAEIIARIRPRLEVLLDRGTPELAFRGVLRAFRAWYRLTDLSAVGNEDFRVVATLNPQGLATRGEFETFALGEHEDKVVTEIREAIERQMGTEQRQLRDVVELCTRIADAILEKHRRAVAAQQNNQSRRVATRKNSGRPTGPRLGELQWKPDRALLNGIPAREFPDSVFLNYFRPASGGHDAETIHIGQFRKDESALVETGERHGDQSVYKDPRFPRREYVKSESGSFVPRKVQRALAKRDKRPEKRGITAPAAHMPATPETIMSHVQGAPTGPNGEKLTPFTSTTKIEAKDLTNAQGVRLGGEYGLVTIDLLYVSPTQIYDLTGAIEQEFYGLANPAASQRQALQDVVRTQEILIHGMIPADAIERLED